VDAVTVLTLNVDQHKLFAKAARAQAGRCSVSFGYLIENFYARYVVIGVDLDLNHAAQRRVVGLDACVIDVNDLKSIRVSGLSAAYRLFGRTLSFGSHSPMSRLWGSLGGSVVVVGASVLLFKKASQLNCRL
jgi:hypothetical protein